MHIKKLVALTSITALMLLVSVATQANDSLKLGSTAFTDKGLMPVKYSCEGEGGSPPLTWSGAPDKTQSFVVIMDHQPDIRPARDGQRKPELEQPEALHWYWSMYNIAPQTFAVNDGNSVGTLGSNSVNHNNEYAPPCSKGPGLKTYIFHLYALSATLDLDENIEVSQALLREKMSSLVLDSDTMSVTFERSCQNPAKPHPNRENKPQQAKPQQIEPSQLPLCKKVMNTLANK